MVKFPISFSQKLINHGLSNHEKTCLNYSRYAKLYKWPLTESWVAQSTGEINSGLERPLMADFAFPSFLSNFQMLSDPQYTRLHKDVCIQVLDLSRWIRLWRDSVAVLRRSRSSGRFRVAILHVNRNSSITSQSSGTKRKPWPWNQMATSFPVKDN